MENPPQQKRNLKQSRWLEEVTTASEIQHLPMVSCMIFEKSPLIKTKPWRLVLLVHPPFKPAPLQTNPARKNTTRVTSSFR